MHSSRTRSRTAKSWRKRLVLSWNAFNGGQDAARRQQTNAVRMEADYRRREAERAITMQVGNAYDAVQSARSTLVTASDRLASAQRAFSLVQRRFAEASPRPWSF